MRPVDPVRMSEACDGCARSKPGRKSDCEIKKALLEQGTSNPIVVGWAERVFGEGKCSMRVPRGPVW